LIIDASVALKWLIRETDSDAAIALLDLGDLIVPDLIFSEIANAIWKKRRRGELAAVPAQLAVLTSLLRVEPTPALASRAVEMAVELDHTAYDCIYLALAETLDDHVVTADQRFVRACAGTRHAARLVAFP